MKSWHRDISLLSLLTFLLDSSFSCKLFLHGSTSWHLLSALSLRIFHLLQFLALDLTTLSLGMLLGTELSLGAEPPVAHVGPSGQNRILVCCKESYWCVWKNANPKICQNIAKQKHYAAIRLGSLLNNGLQDADHCTLHSASVRSTYSSLPHTTLSVTWKFLSYKSSVKDATLNGLRLRKSDGSKCLGSCCFFVRRSPEDRCFW